MEKIGFIGLGEMGQLMVEHLLNAQFEVYAHDLSKEAIKIVSGKGAEAAPKITDVTTNSNVVIMMLPNSQAVESVMLGKSGLLENLGAGKTIIDMGSSRMRSTIRLANLSKQKGIIFLDAPVSGGKKGAADASLTVMCGGEVEHYKRVKPILKKMGKKVIRVGEVGHGHALKAINNYLSATSLYSAAEAMIIAKSIGLDLKKSLEVINGSSGQSYSTQYKLPHFIFNRKFNTGFTLDLMQKDIEMACELAKEKNIPFVLGANIEQIYKLARVFLKKDRDHTEVIKLLELITDLKIETID